MCSTVYGVMGANVGVLVEVARWRWVRIWLVEWIIIIRVCMGEGVGVVW